MGFIFLCIWLWLGFLLVLCSVLTDLFTKTLAHFRLTFQLSDVDVAAAALSCATQVQSLQFWAARSIIASKANYFLIPTLAESSKDYISSVYSMFNICDACNTANLLHAQGERICAVSFSVVARVPFLSFKFYSGAWPYYLTDILSLRLIGAVRVNDKCEEVLTAASPALLMTELSRSPIIKSKQQF